MCVLARRVGDDIGVKPLGSGDDVRTAASALLAELPRAKAADVAPVGAPLQEMSERLSGTHDPVALADRIRALGADPQAALMLGVALGSRQAYAEIVYYALADDEGKISRGPAAVAVFYTKRGRIIAAPSASPAGQRGRRSNRAPTTHSSRRSAPLPSSATTDGGPIAGFSDVRAPGHDNPTIRKA